jgi:dTDP-L-rhamnose 4-epimerase
MSAETVLITGGAGFIGRATAALLVERGWLVVVLDLLDAQIHGDARPPLPAGVQLVRGDVCDPNLIAELVRDADAVLHLAARTGVGQSMYAARSYVETNVLGTAALLDALIEARQRVRRFVVASSRAVYGEGSYLCSQCGPVTPPVRARQQLEAGRWDVECPHCGSRAGHAATSEQRLLAPGSVYAITKRDQEELCLCVGQAYGIETVALRYFNVYGPGQPLSNPYTGVIPALAAQILSGKPAEVYEDGRPLRDFVHVNDVARANVLALEADGVSGVPLNIGSGEPVSILQAAEIVSSVLEASQPPAVSGRYRVGDVRHCYADLSSASKRLGYAPAVRFEEGIRGMAEWLRAHYRGDFSSRARLELERHRLAGAVCRA